DRLCEHGYIDASDVEVRVTAGEVTLEGSVRGRQQKRMAEDVTGQVTPEANVAGRVARGAPMSARQASNAGDRSAPAFSRAGSKSVWGLTLPRAAATVSATPGCRARSVVRNSRISLRTLALSEHAQPTVVRPRACAYAAVSSSVTKTSGRTSRSVPFRDTATGGREAMRPLKRMLRSSDSAQSSAVWPSARVVHPSSAATR